MKGSNINALLLASLLLTGCLPKEDAATATFSEPVYSQQYRQRAITAIVTLSETNIPTSGKIQLMVDVHAPVDTEVALPDLGNLITPFTVADSYSEPVQQLPNGKQLHRRVWTLVPGLPGEVLFQPLEITAGSAILKTAAVTIGVASLLPEGLEGFEIKDISAPVELLPEEEQRKQLGRIAGIAGSAVVFLFLIIKLIRRPKQIIVLTPHEKAYLALQNLPEDEPERIQVLNGILLTFIEEYYKIPLAGKTLNEVCRVLPKKALLGRRHLLEKFLAANEQARFSHIIADDFAGELEGFAHKFIKATPEEES